MIYSRLLAVAAILCVATMPPTAALSQGITPQQAAAGWIMLFDGETTFGLSPRGEAKWAVADGTVSASEGGKGFLSTNVEYSDFELTAEVWVDAKANSGLFVRCPPEGAITQDNAYEVNVFDAHALWPTGSINGIAKAKGKHKSVGKWTAMEVTANGPHLNVKIDGKTSVDVADRKFGRGAVALQYNGEGTVKFRNIRLRPLNQSSLFDSKTLKGWSEVPGHKSVFGVSAEGTLTVKNGNGDLHTDSEWGDFALQLDIISNGKNLNSGVFFRANKGLFWSGYEAQIRNHWEGDDRTKAVDYGTGGIYNRQPARKVVSTDHKWFTMTVIATGLHLAAWVNGYQVSDFQDMRPVNEGNARMGARTKAGVITLQGHDPTTDLAFRNIRILELPAPSPRPEAAPSAVKVQVR